MNPSPRCLITGATGLIGRALIERLKGEWAIIALVRPGRARALSGVATIEADLAAEWPGERLPRRVEAVVHLAQSEHHRAFPERAGHVLAVNTLSAQRLADYAHQAGAETFVLASSGAVYGRRDGAASEADPVWPESGVGFYAATKLSAEALTAAYKGLLNVVALRFFFVYGPGQRRDMFMARLIDSIRRGRPVILQGPEGLRLNPVFVSDAAQATAAALRLKRSAVINVAGAEVITLKRLAEIIGRLTNQRPTFEVEPRTETASLVAEVSLMSDLLAAPEVSLEEGLARMIEARD